MFYLTISPISLKFRNVLRFAPTHEAFLRITEIELELNMLLHKLQELNAFCIRPLAWTVT